MEKYLKLDILKKLDEKGYKYKKKIINNEEYIIITNGISSCAIQIDGDIYSLYEIVHDFGMNSYFLLYRNHNKIENIERIFTGINFLIKEIDLDFLKEIYGVKKLKSKKLKEIRKTLINSGFLVFDFINKEEYILFSNNNKKWVAINYKNNEYIYSYVYVMSSNKVSIGSSENKKEFILNYGTQMIENPYKKDLHIY